MTTRLVKRPRIDPRKSNPDPLKRLRQNKRTPLSPVPFAQALTALLAQQKRVSRSRLQRVRSAWALAVEQVAGVHSDAAKKAVIRSMSKTGVVKVTVNNPGLAHELGVVYREALLNKLRELLQGKDSISDLTVQSRGRRK
jgi:hypothetical protein